MVYHQGLRTHRRANLAGMEGSQLYELAHCQASSFLCSFFFFFLFLFPWSCSCQHPYHLADLSMSVCTHALSLFHSLPFLFSFAFVLMSSTQEHQLICHLNTFLTFSNSASRHLAVVISSLEADLVNLACFQANCTQRVRSALRTCCNVVGQ